MAEKAKKTKYVLQKGHGSHREGGVRYTSKRGENVVESDRELDKIFPGKFVKVGTVVEDPTPDPDPDAEGAGEGAQDAGSAGDAGDGEEGSGLTAVNRGGRANWDVVDEEGNVLNEERLTKKAAAAWVASGNAPE